MELVILIGLQAAGKTSFRTTHLAGHTVVSKDLMPNNRNRARRQRVLVEAALAAGESVVVDNTNPRVEERAELIAQARRHGARVVGYFFPLPVEMALARNARRTGKARVPDVGLFATAKVLVAPSLAEGFDELHVVGTSGPAPA